MRPCCSPPSCSPCSSPAAATTAIRRGDRHGGGQRPGRGDAGKVCDQLTAAAKKELLATLADNPLGFDDIHAKTCEEGIAKLHDALPQPIRAVLADGEVEDAKVDGDTATVHVVGAGTDAELRKIDGVWKITGLSGGLFRK